MDLRVLNDKDILSQIRIFIKSERELLVKILHHLREIERRKLFCDLGYSSLFDYAVKELKYSEGQASRRIQAMRLIKEIPEVETKIAEGSLSLSNVQQAQSLFRDMQKSNAPINKEEKLAVLENLENKSVREGQKELLKLQPEAALPKEKERVVTESIAEIRFLMTEKLRSKLEEVRSLLGQKGAVMSYAELFDIMSDLSLDTLKAKRFGKKRTEQETNPSEDSDKSSETRAATLATPKVVPSTTSTNPRYLSKDLKYKIWFRDRGRCTNCGTQSGLNFDHIRPVALNGDASLDNLRLLCFHCNQRASIKVFGVYGKTASPSSRT